MKKLLQTKINQAGVMKLVNGQDANYGGIRVENEKFVHFTGKGLREIWSQDANKEKAELLKNLPESELIRQEFVAITPISQIAEIIS